MRMVDVTSRPGHHHIPGPLHHRSMILSALGPDYTLTVLFLGTHTRTSSGSPHHGSALACYSLNFGVPTKPKASELPKGLVLGRDENIHIRIIPWVMWDITIHHGSALAHYSLNFGVPTEPETSELPKGLVLGRDENIHIRITPLGDVGYHNHPPLGVRRPRRHTTARVRL